MPSESITVSIREVDPLAVVDSDGTSSALCRRRSRTLFNSGHKRTSCDQVLEPLVSIDA